MTAADQILQRTLVGSGIPSSKWNEVQAQLRDRAFFSSRVEDMRLLDEMRRKCAAFAAGDITDSEARRDLRRTLESLGIEAGSDDTNLRQLGSRARLDAILRMNAESARGYLNRLEGTTPGALAAFPCQELVRHRARKAERKWDDIWREAGGRFYEGRRIARKTDRIWLDISDFGRPYPPFKWGSGMGVRDIDREEALRLGAILPDEPPQRSPETPGMNEGLRAPVPYKGGTKAWRKLEDAFGDQITHRDGEIVWKSELLKRSIESGEPFRFRLGKPTEALKSLLPTDERAMLKDKSFSVTDAWMHRDDGHGLKHVGERETREDNIPLLPGDFDLLPTLWREPDRARRGGYKGSVVLELDTCDGGVLTMVLDVQRTPDISTIYKKRGPDSAT